MEKKAIKNKINIINSNSNLIIGQSSNFSVQDLLKSELQKVLPSESEDIKIASNKYRYPGKLCIDDLEKKIDRIVKKLIIYNSTTIKKNCENLRSNISLIKKKLTGSFIIPDLNDLYQKLDIINTSISELPENPEKIQNINDNEKDIQNKIDKISDAIDQITKIIDKIKGWEDILKKFRNIIITIIENVVNLYEKIYDENHIPDIESKYLTSFFINNQQEYGLVFDQDVDKSHVNSGENLNQFLFNFLDEYRKAVDECTDIFKTNKVYDINYYFQNEILYFINNFPIITDIDPRNKLQNKELIKKIENFKSNLKEYSERIEKHQHGTYIYWHYLLDISKHGSYDSENFFYSIESILKYYEKYTNSDLLGKTCNDFINLYQNESKSIEKFDDPIEKIKEIFDLIQKQSKKYFYFDYFALIFMNNLVNQNDFIDEDQPNCLMDSADPKEFTGYGFSYKFCYNRKNLNLFLRIQFDKNYNDDEKNREIRIFTKNYSDHIVYMDENDEIKNKIPFFPIGTIRSILQNQNQNQNQNKMSERKIELKNVDKIVILLEIAKAIFDLHENKEYHGNISDQIVFINSQFDAYIGSIYSDGKSEESSTTSKGPLYFRSPEMCEKDKKSQSTKEDFQSNDIYSYGVLMHELLTDKSPEMRMENINQNDRLKKLKGDYCDFLFSDKSSNKCFDELDKSGNEKRKSFKEIIKKCLNKDKSKRYSDIKEVINDIHETLLYQQNKEEIECRISQSIKSSSYQCNISDIVLSYYKGQKNCKNYIKSFIEKYKKNELQDETKVSIDSDIIKIIFELIKRKNYENNENNEDYDIEKNLIDSFNNVKNHETQNFGELIDMLLKSYKYNVGDFFIKDSYEDLSINLNKEDIRYAKDTKDRKKNECLFLKRMLDTIQFNGKYYIIDLFLHFLLRNLLKHDLFKSRLNKLLDDTGRTINTFYNLGDSLTFNTIYASYKIHYDGNFNFYLQKAYNGKDEDEIKREKRILGLKYSKYITRFDEIKEENLINRIYFPYFPNRSLSNLIKYQSNEQKKNITANKNQKDELTNVGIIESIIQNQNQNQNQNKKSERKIELSNVDKIVILLEVATALLDLHSHNEYHGDLSDQFIFINSQLDAYIGSIGFDKTLEGDATKPGSLFYYRDSDYFNNISTSGNPKSQGDDQINQEDVKQIQGNDQKDQTSNDDNGEFIKQKQKDDIFSYGVLMHELFTDTHPVYRMGNNPRMKRIEILKGDYYDFLINGEHNECFDKNSKDLFGNNLSDFKLIIEKCLNKDKSERYKDIKEVINSIKETSLYKQNQEEIEYRISHSVDCREYKCEFSDIVESYFRGQGECYNDIEKMLSEYLKMIKRDSHSKVKITGDLIKFIFEFFQIRYHVDYTHYFEDIFNYIIQNYINGKENNEITINLDNKLLDLSIKLHNIHECSIFETYINNQKSKRIVNGHNCNFILPVFTLNDLAGRCDYEKLLPLWIYMISKELLALHSKNLYHGELSEKTIGLYYNEENKIFVPFITLFYSFYKLITGFNRQYLDMLELQRIKKIEENLKSASYSNMEDKIQKYQNKDIKDFKKILKSLNYLPINVINGISSLDTMIDINDYLYNYFYQKLNEKQKRLINLSNLEMDYSSYQINYSTAKYLFENAKSNDFYNNSFINIYKDIIQLINEFLDNTQKNLNGPIINNIAFTLTEASSDLTNEQILEEFNKINIKCANLYNEICNKDDSDEPINDFTLEKFIEDYIEAHKNDNNNSSIFDDNIEKRHKNKSHIETYNYCEHKKIEQKELMIKIDAKVQTRTIEFTNLTIRSFSFLLNRYIDQLNPHINFYIQIKLNKKNDFDFTRDSFTPIEVVDKIVSKYERLKKKPYFKQNNIVIEFNKVGVKSSDDSNKESNEDD